MKIIAGILLTGVRLWLASVTLSPGTHQLSFRVFAIGVPRRGTGRTFLLRRLDQRRSPAIGHRVIFSVLVSV